MWSACNHFQCSVLVNMLACFIWAGPITFEIHTYHNKGELHNVVHNTSSKYNSCAITEGMVPTKKAKMFAKE